MSRSMKFALIVSVLGLFEVGCDSSEPAAPPKGPTSGSMEKGKMEGGSMEKGKMEGGSMEKGKMEGGSMEKGKMEGGSMEKGKMESMPK
jgi:pentapeptide MXKDX repeat protein